MEEIKQIIRVKILSFKMFKYTQDESTTSAYLLI